MPRNSKKNWNYVQQTSWGSADTYLSADKGPTQDQHRGPQLGMLKLCVQWICGLAWIWFWYQHWRIGVPQNKDFLVVFMVHSDCKVQDLFWLLKTNRVLHWILQSHIYSDPVLHENHQSAVLLDEKNVWELSFRNFCLIWVAGSMVLIWLLCCSPGSQFSQPNII